MHRLRPLLLTTATLLIGGVVFDLTAPARAAEPWDKVEKVASSRGMVVCVSPAAADVGVELLHRGGNAGLDTIDEFDCACFDASRFSDLRGKLIQYWIWHGYFFLSVFGCDCASMAACKFSVAFFRCAFNSRIWFPIWSALAIRCRTRKIRIWIITIKPRKKTIKLIAHHVPQYSEFFTIHFLVAYGAAPFSRPAAMSDSTR